MKIVLEGEYISAVPFIYDYTSLETAESHFRRISDEIRPKSWPTLRSLLSHFQTSTFTVASPSFHPRQNHYVGLWPGKYAPSPRRIFRGHGEACYSGGFRDDN